MRGEACSLLAKLTQPAPRPRGRAAPVEAQSERAGDEAWHVPEQQVLHVPVPARVVTSVSLRESQTVSPNQAPPPLPSSFVTSSLGVAGRDGEATSLARVLILSTESRHHQTGRFRL